jgi:multicomponent Na+:H+ antiporter subunit C
MELLVAIMVGVLVAASVHLMLARNVLRFIFGLILISNAANLTIFVGRPPDARGAAADPGWCGCAGGDRCQRAASGAGADGDRDRLRPFRLCADLVYRTYQNLGTLNSDEMRLAEPDGDKGK